MAKKNNRKKRKIVSRTLSKRIIYRDDAPVFKFIDPNNNDKLSEMSGLDLQDLMILIDDYYIKLRNQLGFGDNITFGFEIEFEHAMTKKIYNKLYSVFPNNTWIIKGDGSLEEGAEINSPILKEMRIVDTPGLSDLDDLDRQVTQYLVNADAVMYATSALLPFSETEQVFLGSHIQPQRFGILYVLVNMIDALGTMEDVEKIMKRFVDISNEIVPNAFVYGISGYDELARKMGQRRPEDKGTREFYENQFFKFELSLKRDIIMRKDIIRTKRVLSMLRQMVDETTAKMNMFVEMNNLDKQKLEVITSDFEREAKEIEAILESKKPLIHLSITEMQQQAEGWMYEFFAKLRKSILECLDKDDQGEPVYNAEDIEKFFYPFLMEKVGEAYRTCIEMHREKINHVVEKISTELAERLGIADLSEVTLSTSFDRIMMSMNKNVTRSVMGVKLFGTSETFPPATMTSFSQILKKKKMTTDIIDIALENYDDIRINIVNDIKLVYQDLETKAISQLESICRYQTELGRSALEQAKEVSGEFDEDFVDNTLKTALSILKEPARLLEKYED